MGRRTSRFAAAVALATALALTPASIDGAEARAAGPQPLRPTRSLGTYDDVAGAQLLAEQINSDRVANGLRPLEVRADLTAIAQEHSRRMAAAGEVWHNDELFSEGTRTRLGARRLGENVGYDGGGAVTSHQMYMDSPPHRANILDPSFTAMGIGVTVADGIAYSTEDFMQAAPPPPPPPPPAPAPPASPPPAPPTTEPVAAQAAAPRAAPVVRASRPAPTRTTVSADARARPARSHRIAPVAAATAAPRGVPVGVAATLSTLNAALAWATVLAARRLRRGDWAAANGDR